MGMFGCSYVDFGGYWICGFGDCGYFDVVVLVD